MKLRFSFFVVPALALVFCPVASHSQTEEKSSPSLEQRVADMEKRVTALESIPAIALALKLKSNPLATESASPQSTPQKDVPIELVDWSYQAGVTSFDQPYYKITLKLRNKTENRIKLIDGTIRFADLLDQNLFAIRIPPDLKYAPGATVTDAGDYQANKFIPEQLRMRKMDKSDVKAVLIVRKVVFDDKTVWNTDAQP
jgi:hypothetical protein